MNWKKQLEMHINEIVAYSVGGECGGRTVEDCKKDLKQFIQNLLDKKDKEWLKHSKEGKILTAEASFEAGKNQQDGLRTHFFKRIK